MRRLTFLLATLTLAGCGSLSAEETAREWVAAVNAKDFGRACELSVTDDASGCRKLLASAYRDTRGKARVESLRRQGGKLLLAVEEPAAEAEAPEDWTPYAPAEYVVERVDGEYRVHFEIAVVR